MEKTKEVNTRSRREYACQSALNIENLFLKIYAEVASEIQPYDRAL